MAVSFHDAQLTYFHLSLESGMCDYRQMFQVEPNSLLRSIEELVSPAVYESAKTGAIAECMYILECSLGQKVYVPSFPPQTSLTCLCK